MFILCKGDVAKEPYVVPISEVPVYSLEELCYYIYNNIYSVTEGFFDERLVSWLRDQVHCDALAEKMKGLLRRRHDLKDFVVTILCSCDYYKEGEVRKLVGVMERITNLPPHRKNKIKADNYLSAGKYGRSLQEYKKLLYGAMAARFSTEEYGNLLHNQAIALFYVSSFREAARGFKEAYARNHREESMNQYLYTLLICGEEELFAREGAAFGKTEEELGALREKYEEVRGKCGGDFAADGGEFAVGGGKFASDGEKDAFIERCKNELRDSFVETEEGQ